MNGKANATSFKPGYKRSPDSIEKQRQTLLAKGVRPVNPWTEESKAKLARTLRAKAERIATCGTCAKRFAVTAGELAEGRGKYCSRLCSARRPKPWDADEALRLWNDGGSCRAVALAVGTSPMTMRKWLLQLGIYERRHARREQCSRWRNGVKTYRKIAFEMWGARCFRCGYDRIENVLQVHHVDGNRENNTVENLRPVCPTCHEEMHWEEKSGRYDPTKGGRYP